MNTLPEKPAVVHAGLDIAKATLQLHLQGRQHAPPNTPKGHAQLVALLRAVPGVQIVCEATGGYERAVVAALHAAAIPVSVLNPARVRHFAQAQPSCMGVGFRGNRARRAGVLGKAVTRRLMVEGTR